jgi:hypothetical protein
VVATFFKLVAPLALCWGLAASVVAGCGGAKFSAGSGSSEGGPSLDGGLGSDGAARDGGDASVGDAPLTARSCKELLAARPLLRGTQGPHTVQFDDGATQVWCDMTVDQGGWTLVGRSVANVSITDDFGWSNDHGSPARDGEPFSLDPKKHGLAFTEVLFTTYTTGKTLGPHAFKHTVPADFMDRAKTTGILPNPGMVAVVGGCAGGETPSMLAWLGRTGEVDRFWFQDKNADEAFGLFSDGWGNNGPGACDYSGPLHGLQGMIFVR